MITASAPAWRSRSTWGVPSLASAVISSSATGVMPFFLKASWSGL